MAYPPYDPYNTQVAFPRSFSQYPQEYAYSDPVGLSPYSDVSNLLHPPPDLSSKVAYYYSLGTQRSHTPLMDTRELSASMLAVMVSIHTSDLFDLNPTSDRQSRHRI